MRPSSILVIGSCQARAIAYNLRAACTHASIDYVELNATTLSPEQIFEKSANYDVTIIFALDDAKFGPLCYSHFRANRSALVIPRIYFQGFHPDFNYIELGGERLTGQLMPYHLKLALGGALHRLSVQDTLEQYRAGRYLNSRNSELFTSSRKVLVDKERVCDVTVSDLLFDNSWSVQPLYTFNHPSGQLLRKWIHRICSALTDRFDCVFNYEQLAANFVYYFDADIILPVFPGVEGNKFPLIARNTAVRLQLSEEYKTVSLQELVEAEYTFAGSLSEDQRSQLRKRLDLYPELAPAPTQEPPSVDQPPAEAQAA